MLDADPRPVYLADADINRARELAAKCATPWGALHSGIIRPESEPKVWDLVRYMISACVETIERGRAWDIHPTERAYVARLRSRTPGLTEPLRRFALAAYRARGAVFTLHPGDPTERLFWSDFALAPDPAEAERAALAELRDALAELDDALDGTAEPAAPLGNSVTTPVLNSPEPEPATTAPPGKRGKGPGGRRRSKDGPDEKRIFEAAQANARADLYDIAQSFNTSRAEVVRIIDKHRKRAERAAAQNPSQ